MDAGAFFAEWRKQFGTLSQGAVDGINALIAEMEARGWDDPRWWAYTLATAYWETARTMKPIEEFGRGAGRTYGKRDPETGHVYAGRGFVQLTWRENYGKLGKVLGVDLENSPELALEPVTAAQIMCVGMERGLFTGKALEDYFDADTDDPVNARRIVNGTDKAKEIAAIYRKALGAVKAGVSIMTVRPKVDQPSSLPTRKVGAAGIAGAVLTYVVAHQTEIAATIPAFAPMLPMIAGLAPVLPFVLAYFVRDRAPQ
jgi:hypothetical protein